MVKINVLLARKDKILVLVTIPLVWTIADGYIIINNNTFNNVMNGSLPSLIDKVKSKSLRRRPAAERLSRPE